MATHCFIIDQIGEIFNLGHLPLLPLLDFQKVQVLLGKPLSFLVLPTLFGAFLRLLG